MNMTSPPEVPPSDSTVSSVSSCPDCGADALAPIPMSPVLLSCRACGAAWHHCLGYLWRSDIASANHSVAR
jgi:hypothetical protein